MRINIVQGAFLPVPPKLGGAVEKAWYALGREFARQGHEVAHIGRAYPDLPDDAVDGGVRYRRVRGYATPSKLWRIKLLDLLYTIRASRALPPADILVTNTFWLPLVERRRTRGRVMVHVARFPRGQLRFYPSQAILQTVSSAIRTAILAEVPTASARVKVVPYPIGPSYLKAHETTPERVILYTGRIHPEKGLHVLVEAFGKAAQRGLRGWTLRIVGPWETAQGGGGERYRSELLAQANAVGSRVEWVGPVFEEEKLISHYRRAGFFAYPSLADQGETFGLSILEAMAAGCPAVVSSLACFRDMVEDGVNGMIFDHHSKDRVDRLTDNLLTLACDEGMLSSMRTQARKTAHRFELGTVAHQFIELFSQVHDSSGSLS